MAVYDVSTSEKKASPSLVAGGTLYADSPIGTILPYGGATAPFGWFLCQGQAVSRTEYAELFAVIGTAFGSGDGTSTFNVPDMTGKTAMGVETDHALGASENGALPNVKSNESQSLWAWNKSNSTGYNGALGVVTLDQGYHATTEGASGRFGTFVVDASKSSSIYTNGQTKVDPANVRVNYIIKAKMIGVPADFMAKVDEAVELLHNGVYTLLSTTITTASTNYTLISGRKLSDYDYLIFQQIDGISIRSEILVYLEQFKTKRVILSSLHGANSAGASEYSVSSTNVQYIDDTTVRCYLTGSAMLTTIEVLGVKLAK